MNFDGIVIHYSEIALKGGNRGRFEDLLFCNINNILPEKFRGKLKKKYGCFVLESEIDTDQRRELTYFLEKIPGIANFLFVKRAPLELENIAHEAARLVGAESGDSFKINTRRSNKNFPKTSMEISAIVGGFVASNTGKKVDVHNPQITCSIIIAEKDCYLSLASTKGPGGLPVGISGRIAVFLSGGIDSPVAAWKMMRRGARVDFIHFHSYPYTNKASIHKVKELAEELAWRQGGGVLYLVPFIDIQKSIMTGNQAKYRVLLYRRFMLRIGTRIASEIGATALVTGENLGQVASQTLSNMISVEKATALPILRPLIGENKDDIIKEARKIGTFEISIRPHEDCCSLFVPKNPATKSRIEDLKSEEAKLPVEEFVKDAFSKVEKIIL